MEAPRRGLLRSAAGFPEQRVAGDSRPTGIKLLIIDAAIVKSLAAVLKMAFNAYWEQGVDFEEAGRTPREARPAGVS